MSRHVLLDAPIMAARDNGGSDYRPRNHDRDERCWAGTCAVLSGTGSRHSEMAFVLYIPGDSRLSRARKPLPLSWIPRVDLPPPKQPPQPAALPAWRLWSPDAGVKRHLGPQRSRGPDIQRHLGPRGCRVCAGVCGCGWGAGEVEKVLFWDRGRLSGGVCPV